MSTAMQSGAAATGFGERTRGNESGRAGRCTLTTVVANYNHGHFLPRCLMAIIAQTSAPDEVLVIDDGSTDDSLDVISTFASQLRGFRLIRHEANRGVVATMNEGLIEACGTHVLFAAADDWIEPELVEVSMRMLERFPDAGVCSALTRLATETGEVIGPFRTPMPLRDAGYIAPERVAQLLIRDDAWFSGNTTVINRAAALAVGGYRPELKAFTDMFLNVVLALRHGACFIPRFLAVWRRMHGGYASTLTADPAAMLVTFEAAQRLMCAPEQRVFTPEHVARWAGRWRFSAACGAIASSSPARREWLAALLPPTRRAFARPVEQLARIPRVGGLLAVVLLFVLLRSRDIGAFVRRRVDWMLRVRRLERAA